MLSYVPLAVLGEARLTEELRLSRVGEGAGAAGAVSLAVALRLNTTISTLKFGGTSFLVLILFASTTQHVGDNRIGGCCVAGRFSTRRWLMLCGATPSPRPEPVLLRPAVERHREAKVVDNFSFSRIHILTYRSQEK